jgi:hypothetical protein
LEDADDKLGGDRSEGAGRRGHRDGCNFRAPGPGVGSVGLMGWNLDD